MNEFSFKNKSIWITGASRGIGAALAREFDNLGATVILSSRSEKSLLKHQSEFLFKNSHFIQCDVQNEVEVVKARDEIYSRFKNVDILINNAGTATFKPIWEITTEEFDAMIAVNLRGTFLCSKAVIPKMIEQKNGVIVNINSVAAVNSFKNCSAYGASKAGALALSRSMREDVREFGVKIIDMLVGATETDIWGDDMRAQAGHRMMQPEDIAQAIVNALRLSDRAMIEEILLKPQLGNL
ncbi:MAG TPA: SDR family oxidoreductase [Patescibacteria group bacterium]|nr:SDR family oxidoreductase [Patescibacteria group bacterium]